MIIVRVCFLFNCSFLALFSEYIYTLFFLCLFVCFTVLDAHVLMFFVLLICTCSFRRIDRTMLCNTRVVITMRIVRFFQDLSFSGIDFSVLSISRKVYTVTSVAGTTA